MQKKQTIEFWDRHHEKVLNQEWIVHPSSTSLHEYIIPLLCDDVVVNNNNNLKEDLTLLEIGCGTSRLAMEIYELIEKKGKFFVTDVSEVCIQANKVRDKELIEKSNGKFNYEVFDVVSNSDDIPFGGEKFNCILDKGCLDTFLFRSETRIQTKLVEKLLNKIHSLLRVKGKYIVITPRPKPKVIRNFRGFHKIQRYILNDNIADLDGNMSRDKNKGKAQKVFMFVCLKNDNYSVESEKAFVDHYDESANHDFVGVCEHCGIDFDEFCTGLKLTKRVRQWKGHRIHCKSH